MVRNSAYGGKERKAMPNPEAETTEKQIMKEDCL
jgi:hypothetical protein